MGQVTGSVGNLTYVCGTSNILSPLQGFILNSKDRLKQFQPTTKNSTTISTQGFSINANGWIAGFFADANCVYHGFIRNPSGHVSIIDAPAAGTASGQGTLILSVNDNNLATGYYADKHYKLGGLVYDPNGDVVLEGKLREAASRTKHCGKSCIPYEIPGSRQSITEYAIATAGAVGFSINDSDQITGPFLNPTGGYGGYIYQYEPHSRKKPSPVLFQCPGAGTDSTQGQGTFPRSINSTGVIAGWIVDSSENLHGFVWSPGADGQESDGACTVFDYPGTSEWTVADGINDEGVVTGAYQLDGSEQPQHGFLLIPPY
jgi:hypothetical protein